MVVYDDAIFKESAVVFMKDFEGALQTSQQQQASLLDQSKSCATKAPQTPAAETEDDD